MNGKSASFLSAVFTLSLVFLVVLVCTERPGSAAELDNISVSPQVFNPKNGEKIHIGFEVLHPGQVTVTVFDPSHFKVVCLRNNYHMDKGVYSLTWDGRDAQGRFVPAEAYYFTIQCNCDYGGEEIYNPAYSGGVNLGIIPTQLERQESQVRYTLTQAARIRIRAGQGQGALLRTLLDWVPQSGGEHAVGWDGSDASGVQTFWNRDDCVINASGFTLPPHSMIVAENGISYLDYWTEKALDQRMDLFTFLRTSDQARAARQRSRDITEKVLARSGVEISEYYLMSRFSNRRPQVHMRLLGDGVSVEEGDEYPKVSGQVQLLIELTEQTRKLLIEQRYEVILYIDDTLVLEAESGYSPYTWTLDTTALNAGSHLLTVNIATLNDQVGSWSQKIEVIHGN